MKVTVQGFEPPVSVVGAPPGTAFWVAPGRVAFRADIADCACDVAQLLVFKGEAGFDLMPASRAESPNWPIEGEMIVREDDNAGYTITDTVRDDCLILDAKNVPWVRVSGSEIGQPVIISLDTFTRGTPATPVRVFSRWQLALNTKDDGWLIYGVGVLPTDDED